MKTIQPVAHFITLLLCTAIHAQTKFPGRKEIEKNVTKEVKSVIQENNKPATTIDTSSKPTTSLPASEPAGPAKGQISTFWKNIEKMKTHTKEDNKQVVYSGGLQAARSALNNTKIKDPGYNTAEMEKALAECQAVYDGLGKAKGDLRETRGQTLEKLLTFFEKTHTPLLHYNPPLTSSDAAIAALVKSNDDSITKYKKMVAEFLAEKQDDVMLKNQLSKVKQRAQGFQAPYDNTYKWPAGLDNDMSLILDPNTSKSMAMFTYIQSVKHNEAYFYAATQIYPGEPTLLKAHENCKQALAMIGTNDQFLVKIKKSQDDYLKNVKFSAPKVKDAALEAEFKKHFNALNYKETISKINIQSTDWTVERNSLTGVVIGRSKQAFIATTTPEGVCYVTEFWIMQDYNGSGYGSFRNITNNSFRSQIACENIK